MLERGPDRTRRAAVPVATRAPGPGETSTSGLEPRLQRLLDLQRDAGNTAVAQLVAEDAEGAAESSGGSAEASESTAEDPETVAAAKAVFDQGAAAYEAGSYGKAYDFFSRAYELSARPGLVFSRAQALRRLGGRREEAIELYEQYLATGHGKRDADANKALDELRVPASTGDLEADTAAAKSIFDRGAALYDRGDYAHAYDEFTRANELSPRPGIVFSRAQALRRMGGQREAAIALYEEYLATGHGKRDADANAAIEELQMPASTGDLEADTETGKAIFNKGAALYDAGDFAHAYDEFTRSWELTGRDGLIFSRAQALRRLGGRRDEAITLYEEYLGTGHGTRDAEANQHLTALREQGVAR